MSQYSSPDVNVTTAVATPTDRVRWGPIIAGLFAAMSTLVVLAVLGVAVAGSAYDPGDSARAFGIGAGIWSAISALIAFFVGGWLAARSASVRGPANGILNGAMVWVVAIPLILWMIAGGVGALFRTTAETASTAAARANEDTARTAGARIEDTARDITNRAQDPNQQKQAARTTAKSAWGTLVSLILGLIAAAFGGWTGARMGYIGRERDWDRGRTGPGTTGTTGPTVTDRPGPTDRV